LCGESKKKKTPNRPKPPNKNVENHNQFTNTPQVTFVESVVSFSNGTGFPTFAILWQNGQVRHNGCVFCFVHLFNPTCTWILADCQMMFAVINFNFAMLIYSNSLA